MWALTSGHGSLSRDENAWLVALGFRVLAPPPSAPAPAGGGPRLSWVSTEVTGSERLAPDARDSALHEPRCWGARTPGGPDLLRVFGEVWREIGFCSVLEATGLGGGTLSCRNEMECGCRETSGWWGDVAVAGDGPQGPPPHVGAVRCCLLGGAGRWRGWASPAHLCLQPWAHGPSPKQATP